MKLKKLLGNTYMIKNKYTNVGVYTEDGKNCILIDSGVFNYTKELLHFLKANKLNVLGIINTHGHEDHAGGNYALKQKYGCIIATPYGDHVFVENPSNFFLTRSSVEFKDLQLFKPYEYETDIIITKDTQEISIAGIKFGTFPLPGHSLNNMGIVTPDNVLFVGDALLGIHIMNDAKFPFCIDLKQDIKSKRKLLETNFDLYVPGHGQPIKDITATVENNIQVHRKNLECILELLEKPLNLNKLMKLILNKFKVAETVFVYIYLEHVIKVLLSYLEKEEKIQLIVEDNNLKYVRIV